MVQFKEKPLDGIVHGYSLRSKWWVKLSDVAMQIPERVLLWPWYRNIPIDRPIFIIGPYRSGTTILEQIIAEHSGVGHFWYLTNMNTLSPVTGYYTLRLFHATGFLDRDPILSIHNPRIKYTVYSAYECEKVWSRSTRSQWDDNCTDLTVGADYSDPSFERYLVSMIRRHMLVEKADRFINKNPVNCLRMPYLRKLFPDARFVYIVRDPIDTIVSHHLAAANMQRIIYPDPRIKRCFQEELNIDMLSERIKTANYARTLELDREHPLLGIANQWVDMQTTALDHIAGEPGLADQVLHLRYEEMVSQPVPVLEQVWDFVDLRDEEAEAITHAYAPRLSPPAPPELSPEERARLAQVQEIVAPVASRLGYALPQLPG